MPERLGEQATPELEGIFAGRGGKLIDERLGDESVLRRTDGAPDTHGYANVLVYVLNFQVWNRIGDIGRAFHHRGVNAVFQFLSPFRADGRPNDSMRPGRRRAAIIKGRTQNVIGRRPVKTMLHVVFSRPDNLDGSIHRL